MGGGGNALLGEEIQVPIRQGAGNLGSTKIQADEGFGHASAISRDMNCLR